MTDPDGWPSRFLVAPAKITATLLNPSHRDGAAQCRFLAASGSTPGDPGAPIEALPDHGRRPHFRGFLPGYRAIKLYFEGPLAARLGADPQVRTVWQVDDADSSRTGRFITLKPLPRPQP